MIPLFINNKIRFLQAECSIRLFLIFFNRQENYFNFILFHEYFSLKRIYSINEKYLKIL